MPTLAQAIDTFLLVERRPQTNRQYAITLACVARAIGAARSLHRIRFEDLLDYQASLRQTRQPATVTTYTSIIKAFFNWCIQRRYIEHNPAADLPRVKHRRAPSDTRAIPADELRALVDYTRVTSPRNYALLLFLCDTGCRVGGLVSLTRLHLHTDEGFAFIEEKGGYWQRVNFGPETAAALEAWLRRRPAADHDYVWTGKGPHFAPIKRAAVEAILRDLSERTQASRTWSPHAIRHAVGHAWAKAGIPPHITQEKLGHAHISTTLNFYYPQRDPYVEVASRRLSLTVLKSESEQRRPPVIDLDEPRPDRREAR